MELLWITNHPKSVKGMWPRRVGVEYVEGPPKETDVYTSAELEKMKIVGVYVNMMEKDYRELPLVRSQGELDASG